ncbi:type IV secretion system protein VirB10 [uncultured Brevundimonas sp.]|uniref:type IV secretion system protein VirB10 n=1 Tax=uncultured Brevundimonas sp. TaxID=213418 RepID=UPI0030EB96A9|tara:strand:- start:9979 stop:11115 length:1137 start_codon:yes stop_codon:yes gene_type:complete
MSAETPPPPPPTEETREPAPAHDRGVSPIAGRIGGRQGRLVTLAALAAGCGVFLFATWDRGDAREREQPADDTPPRQLAPFEPARRSDPPLLEAAQTDPLAPTLADERNAVPSIEPSSPASPSGPTPAEQRRALAESAQRAPVLAYSRPGAAPAGQPRAEAPLHVAASGDGAGHTLDELRRVSPIGEARAGRLPDRNLLITAGASVPCVLQTAMDSSTPGYVSCLISRDVYSENGAVVLMERGTRVLGEYRGAVQPGRGRLFVLWTRAVTPNGVAIALASPAADALGRAGLSGSIDTHFWDRFGGALLLSIVDDAAYAAAGGGQQLQSTARVPSDAAAVALQGSIGIPPTLRKAQGSEVSIFVAQDLNFADVYRLRPR